MIDTADDILPAVRRAVADVMSVEDLTVGTQPVPYRGPAGRPPATDMADRVSPLMVAGGANPAETIRIRGRLLVPADQAYERISSRLRELGRTPLLRRDKDGGELLLVLRGELRQARQRVGVAALLFVLTVLSCLFAGAQMTDIVEQTGNVNLNLLDGLPFAACLLLILGCHEFGHYLVARRLGTPVSLPYFIPMPFGPFGTLGAFINMTAPPRNRRHLLAISAAGPLAGLVIALPVLWIGLSLSHIEPLPLHGYSLEGNSLLYALFKFIQFGRLLPGGGDDVRIGQVAFAGWAGLLVTGLNLIPAGQLDGGHIFDALAGEKGARIMFWIVLAGLAAMSILWNGWLLWVVLVFIFGRVRVPPLDDVTPLTSAQRILAAFMLLVFILVFVPVPLTLVP